MKIAFVSGQYPPRIKGGGEVSTHLIAGGLVGLGHEVTVFTEGEAEGMVDGVKVIPVSWPMTAKVLFERRQAKKLARALSDRWLDFDVVHAHDWRSALALSEFAKLNPSSNNGSAPLLVITARDYAQISGDTNFWLASGKLATGTMSDAWQSQRVKEASWPRNIGRIIQYMVNLSYRRDAFSSIAHHIYISKAQSKLVSKFQDLTDVSTDVIYNPVPDDYLSQDLVPGTDGEVLYVGRIEKYKGVELLLKSWSAVAKKYPQAKLRLVGDGAQRQEYEQFVERHGLRYSISWEGHVTWQRLMAVYDRASVVVSPHLWLEPFGRSVVEAMSRGKVVVAADRGGPAEIIRNGETGLLFKHGSFEALEDKLCSALALSARSRLDIGRAAHQWVGDNLSVEVIAAQYDEYYRQILQTK